MQDFKIIAILGGSGSGKTELSLKLAKKLQCEIFSLDSLSIYQEIDIASAKPTPTEQQEVFHYGINVLKPSESNNAMLFKTLLLEAITCTQNKGKNTLLLVGGSSFYLKSIVEGLSPMPSLSQSQKSQIQEKIKHLKDPYAFLKHIDSACKLIPQDTYRINKALEIYFATHIPPTQYFLQNPPQPFAYKIQTYCIQIDRSILRQRIQKRTLAMLQNGILEEAQALLQTYGAKIQPMNSIGLKECVEFLTQTPLEILQGKDHVKPSQIAKTQTELLDLISTHTSQLAKRQTTFNRTQFHQMIWASSEELLRLI